LIAKLYQST